MIDSITIRPGLGVGDLPFGATREETRELFGEADEILVSRSDDSSEIWIYESAALAVRFAAEEDFRFVSCETFSRRAHLNGERIVGLERSEAESALRRAGIEDAEWIEEEDGRTELRAWEDSLNVWLENDAVESIGWSVLVGPDDEILWPEPPVS
ncbi:MAG: hypothetical protein WBX15_13580 [Thermoanaerobaculia bacterium]